ncbi:MAG: PrsW family glutamic-type intramembrane protease [Candidatus Gracilibacteria bacterium]|nr:PrsW family glutamic-type intramembrane protease [Candidatus Gracilibacteria bacterium]MDQ7022350.1 PrsW family glutamic-type intramembrane protease [Candidatus Gracilibacteria bacterium]
MIETIFSIIGISIVSLIPIVIWGYIFSYIDGVELSRKRFIVGLIGGIISVVPIITMGKYLENSNFNFLNIFEKVTEAGNFLGLLNFNISLILFLFIIVGFAFIAISWTTRSKIILKIYLKNIGIFSLFTIFIALFIFIFSLLGIGTSEILNGPTFGEISFNTLKLVIFYYILIAFIEETSKHFNFLQSSVIQIKTVQNGVLYAIFVALGFALIENILYLNQIYTSGGLNKEFFSTYFYRSIFSLMVHVLSSALVGYYFSKSYLQNNCKYFSISSLKTIFFGLFLAILFHAIFDISLTLGFSFMIIIYFIGGYLYISSIFYKE